MKDPSKNGAGEILQITVNETKEDFIQMNIDTMKQLQTTRSIFKGTLIFGIIGIFFSGLFLVTIFISGTQGLDMSDLAFPVILLMVLSICLIIFPLLFKLLSRGTTTSLVNEGSIKTYLGLNTLTFDEEDLHRENEWRYERVKWSVMEKYVETKTHIYVYDSTLSALIIPKRDLTPEQVQDVLSFLGGKIEKYVRL